MKSANDKFRSWACFSKNPDLNLQTHDLRLLVVLDHAIWSTAPACVSSPTDELGTGMRAGRDGRGAEGPAEEEKIRKEMRTIHSTSFLLGVPLLVCHWTGSLPWEVAGTKLLSLNSGMRIFPNVDQLWLTVKVPPSPGTELCAPESSITGDRTSNKGKSFTVPNS